MIFVDSKSDMVALQKIHSFLAEQQQDNPVRAQGVNAKDQPWLAVCTVVCPKQDNF